MTTVLVEIFFSGPRYQGMLMIWISYSIVSENLFFDKHAGLISINLVKSNAIKCCSIYFSVFDLKFSDYTTWINWV